MKNHIKQTSLMIFSIALIVYCIGAIYNTSGEAYVELNDKLSEVVTDRYLDDFKETPIKSIRISSNRELLHLGRVGVYRNAPAKFVLGGTLYGAPSVFYDDDNELFSFIHHSFVDFANIEIADNKINVYYEPNDFDNYDTVSVALMGVLDAVLEKNSQYKSSEESWN